MIFISLIGSSIIIHQVTVAVLQGLAGGVIVYLVMFDIIQRERGKDVSGLLQLVRNILVTNHHAFCSSQFCVFYIFLQNFDNHFFWT